jgi:hypothetical protein
MGVMGVMRVNVAVDHAATGLFSNLQTPDAWFREYIKLFLQGKALRNLLLYACNNCTIEVLDPICTTVAVFLTVPVAFCLTSIGLMPFKGHSAIIFPLTLMSAHQQIFLMHYIQFLQVNQIGSTATQMGGAAVLRLNKQLQSSVTLEHYDVLACLLRSILASTAYSNANTKIFICNVILQRIGVSVGLSRENIKKLHINVMAPYIRHENDTNGNEVSGNEVSGNEVSGNDISENDISENDICGNDISENDISADRQLVSSDQTHGATVRQDKHAAVE